MIKEALQYLVGLKPVQNLEISGRQYTDVNLCPVKEPLAATLYVTGIVQNAEVKTADDGISQRVTTRTGVARIGEIDLPNPVTLKPYRTFPEADQPESDFVFRVRQIEGKVGIALFEADGGRWKLQAALNIKEWLTSNIPGVRVIV